MLKPSADSRKQRLARMLNRIHDRRRIHAEHYHACQQCSQKSYRDSRNADRTCVIRLLNIHLSQYLKVVVEGYKASEDSQASQPQQALGRNRAEQVEFAHEAGEER